MNFSLSEHDAIQILSVENLLNEFDNKEILRAMQTKIDSGMDKFVLDLDGMNFMNSVGLNFLIALRARLQLKGGNLALARPSHQILKLLDVTKLRPMFPISTSLEDAMKVFAD